MALFGRVGGRGRDKTRPCDEGNAGDRLRLAGRMGAVHNYLGVVDQDALFKLCGALNMGYE